MAVFGGHQEERVGRVEDVAHHIIDHFHGVVLVDVPSSMRGVRQAQTCEATLSA
jgi:hypothetical protein